MTTFQTKWKGQKKGLTFLIWWKKNQFYSIKGCFLPGGIFFMSLLLLYKGKNKHVKIFLVWKQIQSRGVFQKKSDRLGFLEMTAKPNLDIMGAKKCPWFWQREGRVKGDLREQWLFCNNNRPPSCQFLFPGVKTSELFPLKSLPYTWQLTSFVWANLHFGQHECFARLQSFARQSNCILLPFFYWNILLPVCLQFEANWIYLFYDKDILYNGIIPTKLIWYAGAPHIFLKAKSSLVPTMCSIHTLVNIYLLLLFSFYLSKN